MLFSWLKKRTARKLLGLDIGSDTIKMLEINSTGNKKRIENFAIASVPAGAIVANEIKDAGTVSQILRDMIDSAQITTKNVAIAIPRSSVVIKNTVIDSRLTADEIESRVWIEANHHFPELIGGIYLDYQILGASERKSDALELMLVACRKEQIDPYLSVLQQSNLTAKVIDVNCYALERSLSLMDPGIQSLETKALLNFDLTLTSLIVVHHNELIYTRDHGYDAHRLMTQVNKHFTQEATVAITESGESEDNESREVGMDEAYEEILKENLISHLRHIMHFFYSSRPNMNIQKLILSGECVRIPRLAIFVKKEFGVETDIADPLGQMSIDAHLNADALREEAPSLMLASGLALNQLGQ